MIQKMIFSAALFLSSLHAAQASFSDLICDDSARLEQQLSGVQGVEKQGFGLRGPDAFIEMWVDPRSGDWTLVQNYTNGTSCIVAFGEHWETLTPQTDPA